MEEQVLELLPAPGGRRPLKGLYLAEEVHRLGAPGRPVVYGNFLTSLDGRIALTDPATGADRLPEAMVNPRDFRLFLELQAQADCLITHGGYLRAVAEGRLDDILQVGLSPATADLAEYRAARGLAPQPMVVVASATLDFPLPPSLAESGQRVLVATGAGGDPARMGEWRERGVEVLVAGAGTQVEGGALVRALGAQGCTSIYLVAGPLMLGTMLRQGQLHRLYLTLGLTLLGGDPFHAILRGPELGDAGRMRLASLYQDLAAPRDRGQLFARMDLT